MATLSTSVEVLPVESDERFQSLASGAFELLEQARGIEIVDDATDHAAKLLGGQVNTALKRWDEFRHWFTDPLESQKKAIINLFRTGAAPAAEAKTIIDRKVLTYNHQKAEVARKEQERLRKLAEARAVKAEIRAEARGEEPPAPIFPLPTIAAPPKITHTEAGSVTIRGPWTWEYEEDEEAAVAACIEAGQTGWLAMNEKAIGAAVRAGVRQIPKVRVFQKEGLSYR